MDSKAPFKWRHFCLIVILLNVCWYSRYALNYWNLEEMMLRRGFEVDHTTFYRRVQAYAPALDSTQRPKGRADDV